jgi:amino acid permease
MSVVVGVLTIDLKANTASFSQSMDKMSSLSAKTANDIKRSLERIAVAGVAMAGAIATGTIAMIKGALDSADALGKMAQSAGTTTETLSVLKYAADLSNVATEDLVKGLEKLSASASSGSASPIQTAS